MPPPPEEERRSSGTVITLSRGIFSSAAAAEAGEGERACTDGRGEMDALVVRMALFRSEGAGRELPSFVTIITELSKHDLGELVGEGRRER